MSLSRHILLPVSCVEDAARLLPLVKGIARGWQIPVLLLGVLSVPEDQSLSTGALQAQDLRQELARITAAESGVEMLPAARVTHDPWEDVVQCVREVGCDLLVLGWQADGRVCGKDLNTVLANPPCDLAIIRPGPNEPGSILLPVRGGPHAELALSVSLALAEAYGAEITAMHAVSPTTPPASDALFVDMLPLLQQLPQVTRLVTFRRQAPAAILAEARQHDAVVMGATARPHEERGGDPGAERGAIGAIPARVFDQIQGTVIAVKTCRQTVYPEAANNAVEGTGFAEPADGSTSSAQSTLVDKWFAENTFHSREFEDIECLLELKRKQGVSISLGLPALNEERTIGKVITTIKEALMDRFPLLDEIVLIDSNSSDATRAIAGSLGIPVHIHEEILPERGAYRGKGEALWKSLHVLQGDIIAWIDTDIINIDPRFVYGVVGPLLRQEQVQYVKGFYRRPIHVGGQLQAGGGGRVTELVARPMLNLFYPVLSGVVQPLSGEYAGRRSALERLPFFTGYGVETGLLIDMLDKFGLSAIAQCDLEERIHKNQDVAALGKMSFQILQVFIQRLGAQNGLMPADINKTMKLVHHDQDGFYLDPQDIEEHERPPMIEVDEYRAARQPVHA